MNPSCLVARKLKKLIIFFLRYHMPLCMYSLSLLRLLCLFVAILFLHSYQLRHIRTVHAVFEGDKLAFFHEFEAPFRF